MLTKYSNPKYKCPRGVHTILVSDTRWFNDYKKRASNHAILIEKIGTDSQSIMDVEFVDAKNK